ncbi:glucosamine-6-phosphate deaminase [Ruminococcaceae bacterium OttesenSCG-928-L11]|nr:glucosamine-6-phosphate deaminase [Ruminococcaceae bacterium OttesenSCG-928-L11]
MNHIQTENYAALSKKAALIIAGQILSKPGSVLGFATGSTPVGTYEELIRLYKEGAVDFGRVTTYNLDEYYGVPRTDPNSYYAFMHTNLFDHINIEDGATHLPNGSAADPVAESIAYEAKIKAAGGVDLQVLGIGNNGHIGFNEPDDHFPAVTHHVQLTDSTIDANSRFYASRDEVPKSALTMGIGTIMAAKKILLLISGTAKKEIMEKALYGPVTPQVPASILQFHNDVTVITDF